MMQNRFNTYIFLALLGLVSLTSCENKHDALPILGHKSIEGTDTTYHQIADFAFVDQDSQLVTNATFSDKIYVADFFFISCPTICPVMKKQMIRVYEKFKDNPEVALLSHTIDPRHDSVSVLKEYASQLGIKTEKWHMVTGKTETIYDIALKSYMVTAMEDSTAKDEGGIIHSGAFVLVDKNRRIRGQYDGTKEEEVNQLMKDMEKLLKEYAKEKK
ncbi:MAG: SCO family protein [Spirosomataceae bacterium]